MAAYNIFADIQGHKKRIYYPSTLGTLISIGRGRGLGEIRKLRIKGSLASWLKEFVPLKYRYSLGGVKMLAPALLGGKK
ncbi:hypothetical protein [Desulforamulus reducens]|uniref:hypothetical protein n=1 Tax=Desulforamulus reducens TaxID=59610 RepID=UPI0003193993|nr:hypothetical protein [Desulforamulus reducens]